MEFIISNLLTRFENGSLNGSIAGRPIWWKS
jgi:hypothetical protein